MAEQRWNKLTKEEQRVIVEKGTEAPFSGQYDNFWQKGVYACRRCNSPLFRSEDKFDAKCGWPSFDKELPGAVKRQRDEDGVKKVKRGMQIVCYNILKVDVTSSY